MQNQEPLSITGKKKPFIGQPERTYRGSMLALPAQTLFYTQHCQEQFLGRVVYDLRLTLIPRHPQYGRTHLT